MLAVVVHGAQLSDSRGVRLLLIRLWKDFPFLEKIWVDGGYKKGCIEWGKTMFGYILEVVQRLGDGFAIVKKRWIVERTFAWLCCYRRMSKDYEHNPRSSEANIKLAMIALMLRRLENSS